MKKFCEKLTMVFTAICGVIITALILIIIVHIILRAFGKPIKGQNEMVQYLTMTMAVLMLSRTCLENKHICVTVFTDHMKHGLKMVVYGIGRILSSVAIGLMTVKTFQNLAKNTTRTTEVLRIPYNLLLWIMVIGLALATIMFFVTGCFCFASIKESKEDAPLLENLEGFQDDGM